jgi:two-component system chemotaxis response regulator CheB
MNAAVVDAPVRVAIVDDSAVVRGMMSKWLGGNPQIVIAGYAVDGVQALKLAQDHDFEVCILDIEMPRMDGLEALPQLLALKPHLQVIMASTLSERGAAVTLRALELGAADFIPKPSTTRLGSADDYARDLTAKIIQLGRRRSPAPAAVRPPVPARAPATRWTGARQQALVIASSTGGPQALRAVLKGLGPGWKAPILIAQHMPAEFTKTLAGILASGSGLDAREGSDGEPIQEGRVYVAPGDFHMTVRRNAAGTALICLDQQPPINWCRPSADPLFASAAQVWGGAATGLVLTGMGHDGRDGARALKAAGAPIMVQDEASSVVWGMPGAVAEAGLADDILPLADIGPALLRLANRIAA